MLDVFIIPSTIQPLFGVINYEDRFTQTLETIQSIKDTVKGKSIIILADSSAKELPAEKLQKLRDSVTLFLDFHNDDLAQQFNKNWLKSHGENYLLHNSILRLKEIYDVNYNYDLKDTKGRMYKLGGRCKLLPSFDIQEHHDSGDNYVFKTRLSTWRTPEQQKVCDSTHLLETRFYSWPISFMYDYLGIIQKNFELFNQGLDTEHAHFINIPKDKLIEKERMHVGCYIAASGAYIED